MYLRTRVWVIVLLALNSAAYAAMADLGGMAAENVRYAALLSTVCVLAVGVCDFLRFRRKHRLLSEICRNARLAAQNLPDCGADALEHDYQALIRAMAQDRAEAVSRMDRKMADLSAYYTLWAHQIKTPIAAMRLLLQQEGAENGELGQELFRIEQYVDMALGYVRLDSDSSDFLLRRCDLDTILRPAVRKFAPQFIRRHLTLRYEPVGKTVLTDEKWLGFVIEQVLSNAVKYTPEGGTVTVSCTDAPALLISDTGIGVEPEDLPRVFEQGFTGYNGRADKKATGLGLYLCRRVCRKLGHTITMDSRVGEGTTVTIGLARTEREHE